MKKSHSYNMMSDQKCHNCGAKLKLRMVEEHGAKFCYKCVKMFRLKWGIGRRRTLKQLGFIDLQARV